MHEKILLKKLNQNNNMTILDNYKNYEKYDSANAFGSIDAMWEQIEQAWGETKKIRIPKTYKQVNNIVLVGMGGSALGGHVVKSVFEKDLKVPFEIINNYQVPGFVNNKSLVILSSYSGTTEEVLEAYKVAKRKKAKLFIIATGGRLAAAAKRDKIPAYIFEPTANYSGQPRIGVGYAIFGLIGILKNIGLLKVNEKEVGSLVNLASGLAETWGAETPQLKNLVKELALTLNGTEPMFVASEHLVGSAHIAANQMNETAKTFSTYFQIPEINHHLMEGLQFPKATDDLAFLFLPSELYHKRIQKRYEFTENVVAKNCVSTVMFELIGQTKLEQMVEVLMLGSYLSAYMAILRKVDPKNIPWVDYFKKKMSK